MLSPGMRAFYVFVAGSVDCLIAVCVYMYRMGRERGRDERETCTLSYWVSLTCRSDLHVLVSVFFFLFGCEICQFYVHAVKYYSVLKCY